MKKKLCLLAALAVYAAAQVFAQVEPFFNLAAGASLMTNRGFGGSSKGPYSSSYYSDGTYTLNSIL